MKINLKKALIITTITSTSVSIIGLSLFVVGGYGNKINSLSEIENSGYFGLNTAFEKEKTNEVNTKDKYVEYLNLELKTEAEKKGGIEYQNSINKVKEAELILENYMINTIKPLEKSVENAQNDFEKDRTDSNKKAVQIAKQNLSIALGDSIIATNDKIIIDNNAIIMKINQSEKDISMLNNYLTWDILFIVGTVFLSIGSIVAVASTSYSIYLKKKIREKNSI